MSLRGHYYDVVRNYRAQRRREFRAARKFRAAGDVRAYEYCLWQERCAHATVMRTLSSLRHAD